MHINCIPRQIPKTGCVKATITLSSSLPLNIPWLTGRDQLPEKITLSAFLN